MSGQGINVGDAVLSFIGDTTRLDATLAALPGKAKAAGDATADAFSGFDEVVDESAGGVEGLGKQAVVTGQQIETSMRGAREQVRFLSEEAGIRLPRAMAGLVSELPGVGSALNLAFSATAIIFAAQKVDELTKKMFDYINAKENAFAASQLAALVAENNEYVRQNQLLDEADKALTSALDTRTTLQKLTTQLLDQQMQLTEASKIDESEVLNDKRVAALKEQIRLTEVLIEQQKQANADKAEAEAIKQIVQYQSFLNEVQERYNRNAEEAKQQTEELNKTLEKTAKDIKEIPADVITPDAVKHILEMRQAAQSLGVTLRSDLTARLREAEAAKNAFIAVMGDKDTAQLALFDAAITKAGLAVKTFGVQSLQSKEEANKAALGMAESELAEARAHGANTKAIEQEIAALKKIQGDLKREQIEATKTKDVLSQLENSAQQSMTAVGNAVASAMQGMLSHQENFGKAMEKAVLSMIAQQAQAWGAYFLSLGTGMMFVPGGQAQGAGLIAEGLALEALAGVLGAVGSRVGSGTGTGSSGGNPNGGGNGGNNFAYGSSVSNTGSQAGSGRTNVSVQAFADGGLVTKPTLALIGEDGPEAVVPLSGRGGSGGDSDGVVQHHTHFNINVKGMISPDNLSKVCTQISKRVSRGQATLNSSSSFKTTKRGA
jgi:hypothetical protein